MQPSDRRRYATKSRRLDLLAAGAVLALILASAPVLPVYTHVTVYDVRVVRVDAVGSRTPIPTPTALSRRSHLAIDDPEDVVAALERRIGATMRADTSLSAPDVSYEWTIRWSRDSPRLDHVKVLTLPGGGGGPR